MMFHFLKLFNINFLLMQLSTQKMPISNELYLSKYSTYQGNGELVPKVKT